MEKEQLKTRYNLREKKRTIILHLYSVAMKKAGKGNQTDRYEGR